MFNIAKKLVKTFEQSVNETLNSTTGGGSAASDSYFQSIPPNLLQFPQGYSPSIDALHGLRVLQVDETQLQLNTFFDYIIGLNDDPLPIYFNTHGFPFPNYDEIYRIINNCVLNGGYVKLNIWSGKGGHYRDEYIQLQQMTGFQDVSLNEETTNNINTTTSNDTPQFGQPSDPVKPIFESLGFKIQWQPLIASTYTYHILSITDPLGAAAQQGLIPQTDYIIGCQDGLLSTGGETLLQDILKAKSNQDIVLYVYNSYKDYVRPVTISLNGHGRLGCNVGYGYLHRIPLPSSATTSTTTGTTTNNMSQPPDSNETQVLDTSMSFQPMQFQPTLAQTDHSQQTTNMISPLPAQKKKTKTAHNGQTVSTNLLDDLQEKEQSSRTPSTQPSDMDNSIAPPPIMHK